jgi:DNA-binding CsgD family transcriptional regulator
VNAFWLAYAALAAGEAATAYRIVENVLSTATGCWHTVGLLTRGRIKLATDDSRSAEADLRVGLGAAASAEVFFPIPDALECLAQLASAAESRHEAARLLGAADALRQRMGAVRLPVFDDEYDAVVSGIRDAIGADFDEAWAEGAALSTDEAIAYAQRGRGERKRPSTGWDSLTPTEVDVVRLVAEGLPNKDIATRLFVSPRTVQTHLRHVYNKLGLTSRVQLAQKAGWKISTPT